MRVDAVLVADGISIREGLLSVVAAGLTRVYTPIPANQTLSLAAIMTLDDNEIGREWPLRLVVFSPTGKRPVELDGYLSTELDGAPNSVPLPYLIALPFQLASESVFTEQGTYTIHFEIEDQVVEWPIHVSERGDEPRANIRISIRASETEKPSGERATPPARTSRRKGKR